MQRHVPDHRRCSAPPPPPPQALRPWPPSSSPWPHRCHRGTGPPSAIAAPGAKGRRWGCGGGGCPCLGGRQGASQASRARGAGPEGTPPLRDAGVEGCPVRCRPPPPRQMHRSRHKRLFRDIAIRTVRCETKGYPDGNGLGARSPIIRNRGKRRAGVDGCHASALTA